MINLKSRAPVRITFGGGATDIEPYPTRYGGIVINSTINKYVYGTLKPIGTKKIVIKSIDYKKTLTFKDITKIKPEKDLALLKACIKRMNLKRGFELSVRSDIPPNTGLGSSASVAVATIGLLNALKMIPLNKYEIAETSYKVEDEDINNKGGRQDQYASTFGGFNLIQFDGNDNVKVNPLSLKRDTLLELEKNTLLVYVGKRKESGEIQKILIKQQESYKKNKTIQQLNQIKKLTKNQYRSLLKGNLTKFAQLMDEGWLQKKQLNPNISNKKIDRLYDIAIKKGAIGGKLMGAGNGGHMLFICHPDTEHEVAKRLECAGARVIDFSFEKEGLQVWKTR